MAVPKKRTSSTKTRLRRSHQALKAKSLSSCAQCGEPKVAHRICGNCGHYKGKRYIQGDA